MFISAFVLISAAKLQQKEDPSNPYLYGFYDKSAEVGGTDAEFVLETLGKVAGGGKAYLVCHF